MFEDLQRIAKDIMSELKAFAGVFGAGIVIGVAGTLIFTTVV